jgi:nucleotide-binding universal stress UspA family protein
MKTILAPVDFSKVSESLIKEAAALARAFDGRVVLLNVVQLPVMSNEHAGLLDITQLTAAGKKNSSRQLEKLQELLENAFVKTESVQVTGTPVAHIVEQAERLGADYIVMGSHGHTALYDLIVGSTTHGVLMRSKCPVVIVPAVKEPAKARKKQKRAVLV